MLVGDLLISAAKRFPRKDAVVFASESLSFAELDRRSARVAGRLRQLGIGPGHRVAILSENDPAALVYFWGILKSGAATVDIPASSSAEVLESILDECRPQAIALSCRQLRRLTNESPIRAIPPIVLTDGPVLPGSDCAAAVETLEAILADEVVNNDRPDAAATDVALIIYTSGTTGRAKGVMLSHRNLISNLQAANELMKLDSNQRLLLVVPFFFTHGRMQILMHAMIGATIIVSQGFQFPKSVVAELNEHRVSSISGVPYHFRTLLDRADLKSAALPDLRDILITGGALPPDELKELSDALPGVDIHLAYGQTEASPRVTYLGPSDVRAKAGSCGRALPGVRVEIVNEQGRPLPNGEIGEVVVSGPNVMLGYVSGDERESGVIDDRGRLHTGDLGRMDSDDCLFLVGRRSEMIKTAGERVFPGEIEQTIETHPDVEACAVVGLPDRLLGEMIVAFVVPTSDGSVNADDIRRHCLRSLPFVRVPKETRFVSDLPKTASGKVDRASLKQGFSDACADRRPA